MRAARIMGLVKTRRLAAMQKQQRAKAGMKPPAMKCGAKKDDDSFWSRNGRKSAAALTSALRSTT